MAELRSFKHDIGPYIQSISQILIVIVLFLSLVGGRMPAILASPILADIFSWSWILAGCLGFLLLLLQRFAVGLLTSVFFILLYLHSYASLFQPSLFSGLPELDYLFFNRVSANYCFVLGTRYITHIVTPFWVFSAAFFAFRDDQKKLHRRLFIALLVVLILNLIVTAVQGSLNINFLSAGSGSSVDTHRAAGLLEDSGASTIIISSLLIFFFASLMRDGSREKTIPLSLGIWALGALLGAFTGGRTYFVLLAVGIIAFSSFQYWQSKWNWKTVLPTCFLICSIASYFFLFSRYNFAQGNEFSHSFAEDNFIIRLVGYFDPHRAAHMAIFEKAIPEYWPYGIGVGGSHIALAQYGPIYEAKGVPITGDAPLNFFVAMVLELGVSAVFILLALCMGILRLIKSHALQRDTLIIPMLLMGLCLLVSFCFGTQFNVKSVSVLLMLGIAFLVSREWAPARMNWPLSAMVMACVSLGLAVVHRYATQPNVPEFFWEKQGAPQTPLSPNVPIAAPKGGRWVMSGTPFAIRQASTKIFVELPPQFYPQNLEVKVFDSMTRKSIFETSLNIEKYDRYNPGKILEVLLSPEIEEYCKENFSPKHYCYMVIKNSPTWQLAKNVPMGFSVVD